MTVRLSIGVQHHPARASQVAPLLAQLPGAELAVDPDPAAPYRSPWRCYQHALRLTPGFASRFEWPGSATHRLVVQDDVELCPGFLDAVHAAIRAKPDRLLAFFVSGLCYEHASAVWQAAQNGYSWAELDNQRWCPVVATCWPAAHIIPFLDYTAAQNWPAGFTADDEAVGRYCRARDVRPLASVPSLVQHPDLVESLLGNRSGHGHDKTRLAACFVGECDAATIDWTLGP